MLVSIVLMMWFVGCVVRGLEGEGKPCRGNPWSLSDSRSGGVPGGGHGEGERGRELGVRETCGNRNR